MAEHPVVHIEFASSDPRASSKFFADVFGWNIVHNEEFDYTMFDAPPGPGGAFPRVDGETYNPGDVLVFIGTDDIEGTLARIEAAGGKTIAPKMEVPSMGWFAIFSDPTGNRLALWKSMQPQG